MIRSFHVHMIRIYPTTLIIPIAYNLHAIFSPSPFLRINTTSFNFYLAYYLYALSWDRVGKIVHHQNEYHYYTYIYIYTLLCEWWMHFSISLKLTIVLAIIGPKACIRCLLFSPENSISCNLYLSAKLISISLQRTLESGLSQTLMHFIWRPYDMIQSSEELIPHYLLFHISI